MLDKNISQKTTGYLRRHRLQKRWQKVVTCLAAVVVFFTTYALILPAITMEKHSYCGLEEHKHSGAEGSCYEKVLTCELEEGEGHTHTEDCYIEEQVLVCGLTEGELTEQSEETPEGDDAAAEESQGHVHDDSCYESQRTLICSEEEGVGHQHDDSCYEETFVCDKEEHKHTLSCYADPDADLETEGDWMETFRKVELTENWQDNVPAIAETQKNYRESENNYQVETDEDNVETAKGYTRYGAFYGDPYGDWAAMFVGFTLHYAGADAFPVNLDYEEWIQNLQKDQLWTEMNAIGTEIQVEAAEKESLTEDKKKSDSAETEDKEAENAETLTEVIQPEAGDLVFLDLNCDGKADHVGIVISYNDKQRVLYTIEGDREDRVENCSYDLAKQENESQPEEGKLLGYISIDAAQKLYQPKNEITEEVPQEKTEETAEEKVEEKETKEKETEDKEEKEKEKQETEKAETKETDTKKTETKKTDTKKTDTKETADKTDATKAEKKDKKEERILEYEGEDYRVAVAIPKEAEIPEEAILQVSEITSDAEEYQEYFDAAVEAIQTQPVIEIQSLIKQSGGDADAEEPNEETAENEDAKAEVTPKQEETEEAPEAAEAAEEQSDAESDEKTNPAATEQYEEENKDETAAEEKETEVAVNPTSAEEPMDPVGLEGATEESDAPCIVAEDDQKKDEATAAFLESLNAISTSTQKDQEKNRDTGRKVVQEAAGMNPDAAYTARFFDISFLVDEEEIEPKAAVDIAITCKGAETEESDSICQVVHFADEGVEVLAVETAELASDETEFTFSQDSFSVTGLIFGNEAGNTSENVGTVSTVSTRAEGVKLNLFDYWIGSSSAASDEFSNYSSYERPNGNGINSHNTEFLFFSHGGDEKNNDNTNKWKYNHDYGNEPGQGILSNQLSDGYPKLSNGSSLDYLFKKENTTDKHVYADVDHLFQVDGDGYFSYDSDYNYAEYHNDTKNFAVYNRTYKESCPNDSGDHAIGFFPLNTYDSGYTCVKNFGEYPNHARGWYYGDNAHYSEGRQEYAYNHHLGLTMEADFQLPRSLTINEKPIEFTFSGDDDMWVFIDGVLILDIGGIHERIAGSINFTANDGNGLVKVDTVADKTIKELYENAKGPSSWDPYAKHTINVFYLERGGCYSNLNIKFNLPFVKEGEIEIEKSLTGQDKENYEAHKNDAFSFLLEIEKTNQSDQYEYEYEAYTGDAVKTAADGTFQTIQVTNGIFTLKPGEKLNVSDLDVSTNSARKYRVTETGVDGSVIQSVTRDISGQQSIMELQKGDRDQSIQTAEVSIVDNPKTHFTNVLREPPTEVVVKKVWTNGEDSSRPDEINVQLYRQKRWLEDGQPEVQDQTVHRVTVQVKYGDINGDDGLEPTYPVIYTDSIQVPDGGSVAFSLDVTNLHPRQGNAVITKVSNAQVIGVGGITNYDQHQSAYVYSLSNFKIDNVTGDITAIVTVETYHELNTYQDPAYKDKMVFTWTEVTGGTGVPSGPVGKVEKTGAIETYGSVIILEQDENWEKTVPNLEKYWTESDSNGNVTKEGTYLYWLKEVLSDDSNYSASYSRTDGAAIETAQLTDGTTVYRAEPGVDLTISNTLKETTYEIPVKKIWNTEDVTTNSCVYLALCNSSGNLIDSAGREVTTENDCIARLVCLDATGTWAAKFIGSIPVTRKDEPATYTIREVSKVVQESNELESTEEKRPGYVRARVENANGAAVFFKPEESLAQENGIVLVSNTTNGTSKGYVVSYGKEDDGTLTATNSSSARLPETGGPGTRRYVFSGLAMILLSLLCGYTMIRRRQEGR